MSQEMKKILETHSATTLKSEIAKTNIKGYSKMKKDEIIKLMLKHQERFRHIKPLEKAPRKVAPKKDPKTEKKVAPKKEAPKPVAKKEAPKPVPKKEAPKPVAKKEAAKPVAPKLTKVEGDIDFEDLFKELGKGFQSRRNIQTFRKKYGEKLVAEIFDSRLGRDFYSTPPHCILEHPELVEEIQKSENIFEPTAGLGALVYTALRAGASRSQIKANDIVPEFADFIRKNFKVDTTNKDYLKTDYKNNNFDLIMINPPFSGPGNKQFYFDFFYKSLQVMRQSKKKVTSMIFISPKLGETRRGDDLLLEEDFTLTEKKKKEYYKKYGFEDFIIDDEATSIASQIREIGECKDFGGAAVRTKVYLVNFFK